MTDQADLIFTGGPVYTVPEDGQEMTRAQADNGSPATAAAVRDGRIVAVGTDTELAGAGRGPDRPWSSCAAARCCPASRTRTCTRYSPG